MDRIGSSSTSLPDTIAGDALLDITNAGTEPHEMNVLRLHGAAAVDQVVAAIERGAPPPGTAVGGMQAFPPGATQQLQLDSNRAGTSSCAMSPPPTAHPTMPEA